MQGFNGELDFVNQGFYIVKGEEMGTDSLKDAKNKYVLRRNSQGKTRG